MRHEGSGLREVRTGLLTLSLAVFAAVTTELLPVGLLPQISATFNLPDARTGLLVTAYAAPSLYQTVAVRTDALAPELAGAWINASSNAGIAGGAAIGGAVLAAYDLRTVAWVAAVLVATAALIAVSRRSVFASTDEGVIHR